MKNSNWSGVPTLKTKSPSGTRCAPIGPTRTSGSTAPASTPGTFDYFTEVVNGESQSSRGDFTASEDDNVLVQGISGDEHSLGFFGYAYYVENADKLKLVGVDGGDGCVTPATPP